MAKFDTLSPVANRAKELFPTLNVRIADYRYPDGDASFVAVGMHHVNEVQLTYRNHLMYDGTTVVTNCPTEKMCSLPQYECIGTFTTVGGVEQFRDDVCLLSEKEG